jgi:nucleoside-diphosphate-sugar epimerase
LTSSPLSPDDRLLVLGGGGWFGQTMLHLIGSSLPVYSTASSARPGLVTWDLAHIRDFAPTVVANFAFLTRERIAVDGVEEFTRINRLLTDQFLQTLEMPHVHTAMTVSSGAAVTEPDKPYGRLKLAEEEAALACASTSLAVVVARAYAVSGPFVRRPRHYAFSDMILQAAEGQIVIKAERPTFRRYASVSDLLNVCLRSARLGITGVIESGGELVEMADLAARVVSRVNPRATVERGDMVSTEPSVYASDDSMWSSACAGLNFTPMDLDAQIDAVARGRGTQHP